MRAVVGMRKVRTIVGDEPPGTQSRTFRAVLTSRVDDTNVTLTPNPRTRARAMAEIMTATVNAVESLEMQRLNERAMA
jgi:hypothetical protein